MAKIAIIGGGSWATALVHILSESDHQITWWLREENQVRHILQFGHNPNYLSDVHIDRLKVKPSNDLALCLKDVEGVFIVIPAAFVRDALDSVPSALFHDKLVVSAVKGMIPDSNWLITDYMREVHGVATENLFVVAGPCHAEEIAQEKRSYLTIAGAANTKTQEVAKWLDCRYVKTGIREDIFGVEYCAVMKNVIAIACGVARGLNYGDNFLAVLVSNAMQEIRRFVEAIDPQSRDLNHSAYLGDLLVTCYSPFSRNRTLGHMVGRGYSVKSAQVEMNMIAEGYYAVKCIYDINQERLHVSMPITKAVYNILYERISPQVELRILEDSMS